jgi:hypothetical protein
MYKLFNVTSLSYYEKFSSFHLPDLTFDGTHKKSTACKAVHHDRLYIPTLELPKSGTVETYVSSQPLQAPELFN